MHQSFENCQKIQVWKRLVGVKCENVFLEMCLQWPLQMLKIVIFFLGSFWSTPKKLLRPNLKVFQYQIWTLVKILKKQLPKKTNFSTFCITVFLIFHSACVQGLIVLKIVKRFEFGWTWSALKEKAFFRRQSWTKYSR